MTTANQDLSISHRNEQVRAAWDRIATGFDRFTTPLSMSLGEEALRRVGLQPGMRFLDVAAGTGALAIPAARLGAEVVATDFAPAMVEQLQARARAEGTSNLEARTMDGNELELEEGSFDVAASQNGVTLFPDLARGLGELMRVTKPGGRVMLVAFGPFPRVEFIALFMEAMQAVVPGFTGLPTDPPPLPFQVADPEVLRDLLAGAGLKEIRVEQVTWRTAFESGRQWMDVIANSNPIGTMLVAGLAEEQRADVQEKLDAVLRERAGGNGAALLEATVNIGIGTK